jgi:hypothetical protein
MTAPVLASRVMKARHAGRCPVCRGPVRVGDQIARAGKVWQHVEHVIERNRTASTEEDR